MPTTFDLSDAGSSAPQPQRPSDSGGGSGTGLPIDDFARPLVWISALVSVLILGYLLWGMYSGVWTLPAYKAMDHATRIRHLSNISLFDTFLKISSCVLVISALIITFRDEAIGYVLSGIALFLYLGVPLISGEVFSIQSLSPTKITQTIHDDLRSLAWIYGVPGMLWVLADFVRRFQAASENAAIQRATVKYGSDVKKQSGSKQVFLGRCWELPYCRDNVRQKCPIFLKRKGPCWWYKQGCMCDERIVLQAVIDPNWKAQTAKATGPPGAPGAIGMGGKLTSGLAPAPIGPLGLDGRPLTQGSPTQESVGIPRGVGMNASLGATSAPKRALNDAEKRERCRNCIIYNEHQRQKYKAIVTVTLLLLPVVVYLGFGSLQVIAKELLLVVDKLTRQFSFSGGGAALAGHVNSNSPVAWILIGCVCIVALAQVFRFIEFCCFKLKI